MPTTTERGYGHTWQRIRLAILERDDWVCCYCRTDLRDRAPRFATVDHVIGKWQGGTDDPSNLVACCRPCQNRKGDQQRRTNGAPTTKAMPSRDW